MILKMWHAQVFKCKTCQNSVTTGIVLFRPTGIYLGLFSSIIIEQYQSLTKNAWSLKPSYLCSPNFQIYTAMPLYRSAAALMLWTTTQG